MNHDQILKTIHDQNPFNPNLALNIYQYGSRVYGVSTDKSDHDVIMVAEIDQTSMQFTNDNISCTVYRPDEFRHKLEAHDISALECIYLPEHNIIKNDIKYGDFSINEYKLRRSISAKASNSFVKSKKKFRERDIYIAKKSLFHSFRIPMFGIQLAKHGKIVDYTVANHLWEEIMESSKTQWDYFFGKYKISHNNLMSSFRKVAAKG